MGYCPECGTAVAPGSVCPCQANRVPTSQNAQPPLQQPPPPPQQPPPPNAQPRPPLYTQPGVTAYPMQGGRPMPGQPMPGQPMPGQPMQGRPMPGQPMPPIYRQPMPPQYPMQNPYGMGMYYQQAMKPAGQTMIRVSGILMTVFCGISFLALLVTLTEGYYYSSMESLFVYELCSSAIMLAFGIAGIALAHRRERASVILSFGVALLALWSADLIWALAYLSRYYFDGPSILVSLSGLVLPILFVIGGNIRRKAPF